MLGHHRSDPGQGPALVGEAVRGRAQVQELLQEVQFLLAQAAVRGCSLGFQGLPAAGSVGVVPSPGRHAGDPVGAGDLGIGGSGVEVVPAAMRTASRRWRSAAVSPPPVEYLIPSAYPGGMACQER